MSDEPKTPTREVMLALVREAREMTSAARTHFNYSDGPRVMGALADFVERALAAPKPAPSREAVAAEVREFEHLQGGDLLAADAIHALYEPEMARREAAARAEGVRAMREAAAVEGQWCVEKGASAEHLARRIRALPDPSPRAEEVEAAVLAERGLADKLAGELERTLGKLNDFVRDHEDPGADAFAVQHCATEALFAHNRARTAQAKEGR